MNNVGGFENLSTYHALGRSGIAYSVGGLTKKWSMMLRHYYNKENFIIMATPTELHQSNENNELA